MSPAENQFPAAEAQAQPIDQQIDPLKRASIDFAERAALLQIEPSQAEQADQLVGAQHALVDTDNPNRFQQAQRSLETGKWTEATRWLALEINRADQQQSGEPPLSFGDAKAKMQGWANGDLAGGDVEAKESGRRLDSALRGVSRPDLSSQSESLDFMVRDVEASLAGYAVVAARSPGVESEVHEIRAVRDALLLKQAEINSKTQRAKTAREQAPGKNTLVDEARQAVDESIKDVAEADNENEKYLDMVPDDPRERNRFMIDVVDKSKDVKLLKAFLQKQIVGLAENVPEGARYAGTVASIIGDDRTGGTTELLRETFAGRDDGSISREDFSRKPFSEVAIKLGIDVHQLVPDYDEKFRIS